MKRFLMIAFLLIFSSCLVIADEMCMGTACMPEKVKNDCTVMESNGCIDWENGIIYATGMGVPNPAFKTQAQKSYSAYEAAKTVAMRNLLQMVEGINISSSKTVKVGMLENDTIQTQISGQLKHVMEAGKPKKMSDGSVWITMKMYMRDIMSVLVKNEQFEMQDTISTVDSRTQSAPIPSTTSQTAGKIKYGGDPNTIYSGLIIDVSTEDISPAMSPKIYDNEGKEIYGSAAVERDFALRYGIVGYTKGIEKALKNERVEGNPLIIKAKSSENNVDLIISEEDAELLKELDKTQTFLWEARVIIIVG
jgi:hypothetical protein